MKIGTVSQPSSKILDNLKMALPAIVKRIKGEWDNIQSLHIKTSTSTSLPIWSCELGADAGGRWDGLVEDAMSASEDELEGESAGEEEPVVETKKAAKGKKRAAEEEVEQPKKKAKASAADAPSKAKAQAEPAESAPKTRKRKAAAASVEVPSLMTDDNMRWKGGRHGRGEKENRFWRVKHVASADRRERTRRTA